MHEWSEGQVYFCDQVCQELCRIVGRSSIRDDFDSAFSKAIIGYAKTTQLRSTAIQMVVQNYDEGGSSGIHMHDTPVFYYDCTVLRILNINHYFRSNRSSCFALSGSTVYWN